MAAKHYLIFARNTETNQRITQQFLDGTRVTDYTIAMQIAQQLAEKTSQRLRQTWIAEVEQVSIRD